jgi:hypothetical protein
MNCGITLVSESVLDYVTAVIFAVFLAERFFVVSILVSTRGLFRKCCPTQRAADWRVQCGFLDKFRPTSTPEGA